MGFRNTCFAVCKTYFSVLWSDPANPSIVDLEGFGMEAEEGVFPCPPIPPPRRVGNSDLVAPALPV